MSFSLVLDGIIVVLLVVTIIYAAILNRRLNSLRRAEGEFADVIAGFNDSAVAAETLLSEVKAVATAGAGSLNRQQLNQQIQAGRGLVDDLGYLLQKGEALADQLSSAVTSARAKADHLRQSISRPPFPRSVMVSPVRPGRRAHGPSASFSKR